MEVWFVQGLELRIQRGVGFGYQSRKQSGCAYESTGCFWQRPVAVCDIWGFERHGIHVVRNTIVEDTFPRSFNVKNKRFAGATFRVDKANKRKLEARVFDRLGKDFLAMQESGGTKRPRGNNVAIPTDEIRVTGRGVAKARRPRQILQSGKRAFKTRSKTGQEIIAQRRGKKRYPLKVLYILEPQAQIKPRFSFYAVD